MTNRPRSLLGLGFVISLCLAHGCSSASDSPPAATPARDGGPPASEAGPGGTPDAQDGQVAKPTFSEATPGVLESVVRIVAATGARIELPGGAVFDVPAGAIAADTDVTVRVPKDQSRASRFQSFRFEPTSLTFSKPATLSVPYDQVGGKEPTIRAWSSGDFNPLVAAGSELTDRAPMKIVNRDAVTKTVAFEVPHFTFFNVLIQVDDLLYLVPHIPAKYLLPGDMVFVMTAGGDSKGPHWNPGHVGVFTGGGQACVHGVSDSIIESTTASEQEVETAVANRELAIKQGKPLPPIPQSGVRNAALGVFKREGGHFYMGARRPGDGQPVSGAERTSIVDFCKAQVGKDYNIIGQGNINESSWSCVGLAEAAYDNIGRGSMGAVREAFAGTPLELYWNTKPVEEMTIGVGESLEMVIDATAVHPDSFWPRLIGNFTTAGWYCDAFPCGDGTQKTDVTITLESGKPPNAELVKAGKWRKRLHYVPPPEDAGKSYDLLFKAVAPIMSETVLGTYFVGNETREYKLRINVVPCPAPTPPPACLGPADTPEHRTACLVGGEDAKAQVSAVLKAIAERGEHGHSNPLIRLQAIHGRIDLTGVMSFLFDMTAAEYTAAFGNSHLPCGVGPYGLTLCGTAAASAGSGQWLLASARMRDEIPLADPNHHYQYAFVFDQDDSTTNNYPATAPYTADYFANTDRWYEAAYAPATGWQLKTRNANQASAITNFASAARFIIANDTITLAVPKSELASASPKFRVTAFTHKGDFGINAPHWYSADTHPHVGQPLLTVPTN